MNNYPNQTCLFILFFSICLSSFGQNQDSLPPGREMEIDTMVIDTTVVDTVVIRKTQEKIKFVPRSVDLMNPVISFNRTNALDEKPNRFIGR